MSILTKKKLISVAVFLAIVLSVSFMTGTNLDSIFIFLILGCFAIVQIINFIAGKPFLLAGPGYFPDDADKIERGMGIIGIIILGLFCLYQLYEALF